MTYKPKVLPVADGGTGVATLTNHGVLIGQAASSIVATAAGTAGQVLQSGGASADPTYSTATYPATAGSSGKILVSDGTNIVSSTPTFPNASATSRKIIVSDGTNWVASTETYAVPGTSGNVLTSDGTNWTSAAASGGNFLTKSVTLTSSQIKNLHATPIEIIAAPGSGKGIVLLSAGFRFNYGGSNVFVAGSSQTIGLYYNNNTTSVALGTSYITNATIVGSANAMKPTTGFQTLTTSATGVYDNVNIAAYNSVVTEISGNAANDNTIDILVSYWILTY